MTIAYEQHGKFLVMVKIMRVVALRGKSNTGKSDTLKRLIQTLSKIKQPLAFDLLQPTNKDDTAKDLADITMCANNAPLFNGDVYAVFDFEGVCIGISTQGDIRYWLEKAYEKICNSTEKITAKATPDIFICAIRSFGETNNFVIDICNEQPVVVYDKMSISSIGATENFNEMKDEQTNLNCIQAKVLFEYLLKVISCGG